MYYELWNVDIGNVLARYRDERAMAALVRTLVSNYGDEHGDELDLTIEDESGEVLDSLSSAPLIQWADAVLDRTATSTGLGRVTGSSVRSGPSSVRDSAAKSARQLERAKGRASHGEQAPASGQTPHKRSVTERNETGKVRKKD